MFVSFTLTHILSLGIGYWTFDSYYTSVYDHTTRLLGVRRLFDIVGVLDSMHLLCFFNRWCGRPCFCPASTCLASRSPFLSLAQARKGAWNLWIGSDSCVHSWLWLVLKTQTLEWSSNIMLAYITSPPKPHQFLGVPLRRPRTVESSAVAQKCDM